MNKSFDIAKDIVRKLQNNEHIHLAEWEMLYLDIFKEDNQPTKGGKC